MIFFFTCNIQQILIGPCASAMSEPPFPVQLRLAIRSFTKWGGGGGWTVVWAVLTGHLAIGINKQEQP